MSEQGHSEREPWLVSARGRLAVEDDGPAAVGTARTASRGACWCLPGRRSATSSCWASRGRWADLGECVAGRRGDARGPRGIRLGDTTSAVACVVAALPLLLLHREHRHRSVDRAATPGPSCPISGEAWVDRVGRLTRPVTPWVVSHALRPWRRHAGAPVQLPLGARRWLGDVADPGSLVTAAGIANGTSSSLCGRPLLTAGPGQGVTIMALTWSGVACMLCSRRPCSTVASISCASVPTACHPQAQRTVRSARAGSGDGSGSAIGISSQPRLRKGSGTYSASRCRHSSSSSWATVASSTASQARWRRPCSST